MAPVCQEQFVDVGIFNTAVKSKKEPSVSSYLCSYVSNVWVIMDNFEVTSCNPSGTSKKHIKIN